MTPLSRTLTALCAFCGAFLTSGLALAQEAAAINPHTGYLAAAVAVGIGLAAVGGAAGQARAAAAALEGIGRNPSASGKMLVSMLLALAFIETLVLLTFALMSQILGKA